MNRLILFFILLPFISFSQKRDYKSYDKAIEYFNEGKIDKSKKLLLNIINKSKDWDNANLLMYNILTQEGDIDAAVSYLLNIYDENNIEDIEGFEKIGKLYFKNGKYKDALYYFNIAFGLDSTFISNRTLLLMKKCDYAITSLGQPLDFNPVNLGKNINTEFAEYLPAISLKDDNIVFTRRILKNGYLQEDFYISEKESQGEWKAAYPFPGEINTFGNEGAFSFSPNKEKVVYTACNRVDGKGRCDLYFLINNITYNAGDVINTKHWESQGVFSPDGKYLYFVSNRPGGYGGKDIWRSEIKDDKFLSPENLGDRINTMYDEMSPFVHADNLTLYFASDGHIGLGGYDLFVSRRDSAGRDWNSPKNLGFPINTHNTENSLIVSSNGSTAYFSSDKHGFGKEDIFSFELPIDLQAEPIQDVLLDLIITDKGDEIILNNVHFDNSSSSLDSNSFLELDKLSMYLKNNPTIRIVIEGHTDNIGSPVYNTKLSNERAREVYNYLLLKSVDANQLVSYIGYGSNKPISTNNTNQGKALNRRTSFRIIN